MERRLGDLAACGLFFLLIFFRLYSYPRAYHDGLYWWSR